MLFNYVNGGIICTGKKMGGSVFISDGLYLKVLPIHYKNQMSIYDYDQGPYDGNLKSYIDDDFNNIFSYRTERLPFGRRNPIISVVLEVKRSGYSLADQKLLPIFKKLYKMKGFL